MGHTPPGDRVNSSQQRSPSSENDQLDTMHKELFDLQRRLLTAPRKERKQLKREADDLDTRITEVSRAVGLLHHGKDGLRESEDVPLASFEDDPRSSSVPDNINRLMLDELEPYQSSEEGSQNCSQDSDQEAAYSYHQQLMGYSTAHTHLTTATMLSEMDENATMVTCENATELSHTECMSAALGSSYSQLAVAGSKLGLGPFPPEYEGALPAELAFLQNFSFLEELEQREEEALLEELGLEEDDEMLQDLRVHQEGRESCDSPVGRPHASRPSVQSDAVEHEDLPFGYDSDVASVGMGVGREASPSSPFGECVGPGVGNSAAGDPG